jgi:MoaA/NifB/PqqE/SkfB family radical SAM enzyme
MSMRRLMQRTRQENVLHSALLELTYRCNLDCLFCYNDLALREPLLYRHFFEIGAQARKRGFVVKVKSNGVGLNAGNAQRLKEEVDPFLVEMSIHGARPETHDGLTQVVGSFERLLRNIGLLQEAGLRLRLNSPLTRLNEGEVEAMLELADQLGVPLHFDPEITPRDDGDLSPLDLAATEAGIENMARLSLERSRARNRAERLPLRVQRFEQGSDDEAAEEADLVGSTKICGAGSTHLVFDPFGNVYPCVQLRRKVGNIHDQTVREIWGRSSGLVEVRDLAVRAYDVARAENIGHLCMGLNEMRSGDPLVSPESKLRTDRILKRLSWEEDHDG